MVLEAKSGSFTHESAIVDYNSHKSSIDSLIDNPVQQAYRFLDLLVENKTMDIELDNGQTKKLSANSFDHYFVITVSLEQLTRLTAQQKLVTSVDVPQRYGLWQVSIDDLKVITELINSPMLFLLYLSNRNSYYSYGKGDFYDELDHLGFFIDDFNYFNSMKNKIEKHPEVDSFTFASSNTVDEHYDSLQMDIENKKNPVYNEQGLLLKIINEIAESENATNIEICFDILKMDIENRKKINKTFVDSINNLSTVKPFIHFFSNENQPISAIVVLSGHEIDFDFDLYSLAAFDIIKHNSTKQLICMYIEILNNGCFYIDCYYGNKVRQKCDLSLIENEVKKIKRIRCQRHLATGKIGRNAQCPCNSGKKYKKCCG